MYEHVSVTTLPILPRCDWIREYGVVEVEGAVFIAHAKRWL